MDRTEASDRLIRRDYDWTNETPSTEIIDAIASIENIEPVDLPEQVDTPLYSVIDPEALNSVITGDSPAAVSFSYEGYHIRIDDSQLEIC